MFVPKSVRWQHCGHSAFSRKWQCLRNKATIAPTKGLDRSARDTPFCFCTGIVNRRGNAIKKYVLNLVFVSESENLVKTEFRHSRAAPHPRLAEHLEQQVAWALV